MSNPDSRDFLLGLIMNRDIPVPGVPGLKFKILERGGSVGYSNILGSGISARGGASVSGMGQFQAEVHVGLDLARWVPLLR